MAAWLAGHSQTFRNLWECSQRFAYSFMYCICNLELSTVAASRCTRLLDRFHFLHSWFPKPSAFCPVFLSKWLVRPSTACRYMIIRMLVRDPDDTNNTFVITVYAIIWLKYVQCSLDWMKEPATQSTFAATLLHLSFLQRYLLTPAALLRYPAILSLCAVASSALRGATSQANEFILNKGVINLLILSPCFLAT